MITRCPIYTCNKFIGCRECKLFRNLDINNLKSFNTNNVSWIELIQNIQLCKLNNEDICLKTEKDLPKEIIWELAYSSKNILQLHTCILTPFKDLSWAIELVHLAEICGICCNLLIFPIIPTIVKVSDVLRIIDSVRNCNYCKIFIKFSEFMKYEVTTSKKYLMLDKHVIPMEHLIKCTPHLYKCSDSYREDFFQLIKFYTDNKKLDIILL